MSCPVLVVSPHLDDAVLSCGRLLAVNHGSCVVTVFAGRPYDDRFVEWDEQCGYQRGDDVMGARRREDRRALRLLRARPVWLDFRADVYRDGEVDVEAIRRAVAEVVRVTDPGLIAVPLGLYHEDHLLISDMLLDGACAEGRPVHVYADEPYMLRRPDLLARRLADLPQLVPTPGPSGGGWRKGAAIYAYRSQLRALGGGLPRTLGNRAEHYWVATAASPRA